MSFLVVSAGDDTVAVIKPTSHHANAVRHLRAKLDSSFHRFDARVEYHHPSHAEWWDDSMAFFSTTAAAALKMWVKEDPLPDATRVPLGEVGVPASGVVVRVGLHGVSWRQVVPVTQRNPFGAVSTRVIPWEEWDQLAPLFPPTKRRNVPVEGTASYFFFAEAT